MPKFKAGSIEIELPEIQLADSPSPAVMGQRIAEYQRDTFSILLNQVQALRDPNVEKIAERLKLVDETSAAAHKKAVEASETLAMLAKAKPEIDRNLDLRLFESFAMTHDVRHLNFSDGDNWHKTTFSADNEADARGKLLQFNLLVAGFEDFEGFDEKSLAIVNRWRALNDMLVVEDGLARASKWSAKYLARGGIKSLARYAAYQNLSRQIRETFASTANADATAALGAEWDPTGVSMQLLPDIWPELGIISQFPTVPMSRSPMLFPVMNPFVQAYLLTEALDATASGNTAIATRQLTTRNVTLTARKFGYIDWYSSEFEEDSIVALAAAIRATGTFAIEAAKEDAAVNGQASAISGTYGTFPTSGQTTSTFDTGGTFTGTANQETPNRAWDGLRYAASLTGLSEDASTGLIAENLANIQGKLGRFSIPQQCFFWTGYMGRAKLLTLKDAANTAVILTAEKAGGDPSFRSGVVGKIFGVSDLVASYYQSQVLNASGYDDGGAQGYTQVGIANRLRWALGTVRLTRVEILREIRADVDQIGAKFTHRCILKPTVTPSATDQPVGVINGIKV